MGKKPEQKKVQGHCPHCGPARFADIVCEYVDKEFIEEEDRVWAQTTSRILQCGGCRSVYYQEIWIHSDDWNEMEDSSGKKKVRYTEHIKFYPAPAKRKRPEWIAYHFLEERLQNLLDETYNTLDVDARILAATGARTIFDRAAELLKIDAALTFGEKLDLLYQAGHIGSSERDHLTLLTDAGGAAAHRGWMPTPHQLNTIMSIVEAFIYRAFILDAEVKVLKKQIPPRPPRKKKIEGSSAEKPARGLYDVPRVAWSKQGDEYMATWLADPALVRQGYPIEYRNLWAGKKEELTTELRSYIDAQANMLQAEMKIWASGGIYTERQPSLPV